MTARHHAIHRRTRQGAVAVRGALVAQASVVCVMSKRLPSHPRAASYLPGYISMANRMDSSTRIDQPNWLGNGFEDTAPSPGGGCSAGQ